MNNISNFITKNPNVNDVMQSPILKNLSKNKTRYSKLKRLKQSIKSLDQQYPSGTPDNFPKIGSYII